MRRIAVAPKGVKGISLKLQEEQREKRLDFVPKVSALSIPDIRVDIDTKNMLKAFDMGNIPGVKLSNTDKRRNRKRDRH